MSALLGFEANTEYCGRIYFASGYCGECESRKGLLNSGVAQARLTPVAVGPICFVGCEFRRLNVINVIVGDVLTHIY